MFLPLMGSVSVVMKIGVGVQRGEQIRHRFGAADAGERAVGAALRRQVFLPDLPAQPLVGDFKGDQTGGIGGQLIGIGQNDHPLVVKQPIPVPEKAGYIFEDWYTDEELTVPAERAVPIGRDVTFYAKWAEPEPFCAFVKGEEATQYQDGETLVLKPGDRVLLGFEGNVFDGRLRLS